MRLLFKQRSFLAASSVTPLPTTGTVFQNERLHYPHRQSGRRNHAIRFLEKHTADVRYSRTGAERQLCREGQHLPLLKRQLPLCGNHGRQSHPESTAQRKNHPAKNVENEIYRAETLQGDIERTILHGACLIFSPDYIKRFEGLHDETFLYMEEDILKLYADYYGFLMLYSSDLQIYHKEDAATNMAEISDREKVRRKDRLLIDSSKIYSRLKKRMIRKKTMIQSMRRMAQMIKPTGKEYQIDLDIPLSYLAGMSLKRIKMIIRGKIKTLSMKKAGKIVFCGKNVKLICRSKMRIGTGVTIQDNVYMDALSKAGITIEDGCSIGAGTTIRCSGNLKEIGAGFYLGKDSSLADHCFVGATGGVSIGDHVIGGQNIRFHSSNHRFSDSHRWIKDQGITSEGIRIGNNCWIGAGAVFCDGVTIGDGCVIAANAVVTKNFSANSVIAGVPAKTIAKRSRER